MEVALCSVSLSRKLAFIARTAWRVHIRSIRRVYPWETTRRVLPSSSSSIILLNCQTFPATPFHFGWPASASSALISLSLLKTTSQAGKPRTKFFTVGQWDLKGVAWSSREVTYERSDLGHGIHDQYWSRASVLIALGSEKCQVGHWKDDPSFFFLLAPLESAGLIDSITAGGVKKRPKKISLFSAFLLHFFTLGTQKPFDPHFCSSLSRHRTILILSSPCYQLDSMGSKVWRSGGRLTADHELQSLTQTWPKSLPLLLLLFLSCPPRLLEKGGRKKKRKERDSSVSFCEMPSSIGTCQALTLFGLDKVLPPLSSRDRGGGRYFLSAAFVTSGLTF